MNNIWIIIKTDQTIQFAVIMITRNYNRQLIS